VTSPRATVQRALRSIYEAANRLGVLEWPAAETVFRGAYFTYKRFVEDPFARLVRARPELFVGGDIIDVGANIGYTATLFARAAAPPYRVHAFEPELRNHRWLCHAIDHAGLTDRVVPHRAAVGSREGTLELWYNAAHHGDHRVAIGAVAALGETQSVPVTTVDAHVARSGAPPIAFVKIDVQGYEPEVLRGMRETIARNPALHVAVELMPSALVDLGFDPDAFLDELAAALPALAILERDGHLRAAAPRAIADEAAHDPLGYVDLVCTRG
jgi:FkbM family methyltransferase